MATVQGNCRLCVLDSLYYSDSAALCILSRLSTLLAIVLSNRDQVVVLGHSALIVAPFCIRRVPIDSLLAISLPSRYYHLSCHSAPNAQLLKNDAPRAELTPNSITPTGSGARKLLQHHGGRPQDLSLRQNKKSSSSSRNAGSRQCRRHRSPSYKVSLGATEENVSCAAMMVQWRRTLLNASRSLGMIRTTTGVLSRSRYVNSYIFVYLSIGEDCPTKHHSIPCFRCDGLRPPDPSRSTLAQETP